MGRPADQPNVFRQPTGILESLIYRASLRIPQPNLHGASGRYTPEHIRVQTASAGSLISTTDPTTGFTTYSVMFNARPIDR